MKGRFEGYYLKHQSPEHSLALIPGKSMDSSFIQVITERGSYNVSYPNSSYRREGERLLVGDSEFSSRGVKLDIYGGDLSLRGVLDYGELHPIKGDIMGPFKLFPMECRHTVISMEHSLTGSATLNGERISLDSGKGYIEGDSGRSFPKQYAWVQCNAFEDSCSIMSSAALIPFLGSSFWGTICVVMLEGKEYRLATYRGAKIRRCKPGVIEVSQGDYLLEVSVSLENTHKLSAPASGVMTRSVWEAVESPGCFRFSKNGRVLFEGKSDRASHEFSGLTEL